VEGARVVVGEGGTVVVAGRTKGQSARPGRCSRRAGHGDRWRGGIPAARQRTISGRHNLRHWLYTPTVAENGEEQGADKDTTPTR